MNLDHSWTNGKHQARITTFLQFRLGGYRTQDWPGRTKDNGGNAIRGWTVGSTLIK